MNYLIGIGIALILAFLFIRLGNMVRERFGLELGRYGALAVGVGFGLVIWFLLRWGTGIHPQIIDGIGLGPAVGLAQSLRRPEQDKEKGK